MLPAWGAWRQACLPPQSSFRPTPIAWPALHWLAPAPPEKARAFVWTSRPTIVWPLRRFCSATAKPRRPWSKSSPRSTNSTSRPETKYRNLPNRDESLSDEVIQQVEIVVKYAGYVERQETEVARSKSLEDKNIPVTFDFSTVPSLRLEARQKFEKIRPQTIGQAARISGVSPADISILLVWLKRAGATGLKRDDTSANGDVCAMENLREEE